MDVSETYLDEKFAELRRAQIASAAATIYVALLDRAGPVEPDAVLARLGELRAQAARTAIDLYFMV